MKNHRRLINLSCFMLILICWGISSEGAAVNSLVPQDLPEEWALIEGPRTFTKKTLFEHINGQAELFLKYGFQKSVFAIFQDLKNRESQIEMDIYNMGNVLHAFGIFSRFRNEDRPGGIGLDSSVDDHSAFFYKGKYFVMLYATEPDPDLLRRFSKTIASKISDPSPPPKEIGYFPKSGLKPGSIQYIPEGLLGHQFLNRGFQGTYIEKVEVKAKAEAETKDEAKTEVEVKAKAEPEVEDKDKAKTDAKEFHFFLSIFKNSHDATMALKTYRGYLSQKGKIQLGTPASFDPGALKGEDPYKGQVIVLQKSFHLLGVVGFERESYAENLLKEFMKNMR